MIDSAFAPTDLQLIDRAREAAKRAYCPYSSFPVGAAVETDIGLFTGCNVENASYGLAVCAERVALFSAIAQGARRILRLAVSCPAASQESRIEGRMPCGACRQVIAEFMPGDAFVFIDGVGALKVAELLPHPFQLDRRPFLDGVTKPNSDQTS